MWRHKKIVDDRKTVKNCVQKLQFLSFLYCSVTSLSCSHAGNAYGVPLQEFLGHKTFNFDFNVFCLSISLCPNVSIEKSQLKFSKFSYLFFHNYTVISVIACLKCKFNWSLGKNNRYFAKHFMLK